MSDEQTHEELEIRSIMEHLGCDEDRARFIRALARGEIQGDVVVVDTTSKT